MSGPVLPARVTQFPSRKGPPGNAASANVAPVPAILPFFVKGSYADAGVTIVEPLFWSGVRASLHAHPGTPAAGSAQGSVAKGRTLRAAGGLDGPSPPTGLSITEHPKYPNFVPFVFTVPQVVFGTNVMVRLSPKLVGMKAKGFHHPRWTH